MIEVKLKEIREKKKLAKIEMAKLVGIAGVYGEYSALENGTRLPRVDKAIKIAASLGKKVEQVWILW